jgi:glycosyltransferase involved in cell wall biosynthesis
MRPPAVALVASSYAPDIGGVETHVAQLARGLRARGHEVQVWTVDRAGRSRADRVDGVEVRYLPTPLPARSLSALARFGVRAFPAWRAWRRAARAFRPDVVHVHCFGPNGVYADAVHRRLRLPLVLTSHGETLADDGGVYQRSAFLRDALARGIRSASAVTAPSEYVLDDLRRRFGLVGGLVVPNGVDAEVVADPAFALPAPRGSFVLGVGRLGRMKGFDLLIAAFARAGLDEDATLVIAGDGPERDALRAAAGAAGVGERVIFTGAVTQPEVAALMAGASLVAVPSRAESFGIAALEAWRAGAPLVMTRRGGAPGFMTDGRDAMLVDPEDTAALAEALRTLSGDPALRKRLAEGGARRVREFTWDRVVEGYEALYRAATAEGAA